MLTPAAPAPQTMACVEIAAPGGPEALRLATRPTPLPKPGEILIEVAAAGVNGADLYQRRGLYPPPPGASDLLGLEVSGTVAAVGEGVLSPSVGDAVCALLDGGGYAQYCVAPAAQSLPIPAGVAAVDAAGLPETACTVWANVFERGRLAEGETLLVHGGAGGIGVMAVQLAVALGHTVFATAGGPEKRRRLEALGVARAIDYRSEDFVAVIKEATGGKGVDVILDIVGGDYVARNLACLAREGRLVNIAFRQGSKVTIDLMPVMLKRLTLTGSTLRILPVERKGAIVAAVRRVVWPLIEAGRIAALTDRVLPLARAADAHRAMEASEHVGKILLAP